MTTRCRRTSSASRLGSWYGHVMNVALLILLSLFPFSARAQSRAHANRQAVTKEKLALAGQLTFLLQFTRSGSMMPESLLPDSAASPHPFSDAAKVLAEWTNKYMPPDTVEAIRARILAETFSEMELRGLITLFTSPIAKRFLDARPGLLQLESEETNRVLAAHREELRERLMAVPHLKPGG